MFIQKVKCLFWAVAFLSVCLLGGVPAVFAQTSGEPQGVAPAPAAEGEDPDDVLGLDIEQLANTDVLVPAMNVDIETVSRTTQKLARTASAVYVVNSEMIKRSGARNIPEVLRTVPGVNVARINASAWAISVRGINGRQAGMLLVQIDGVAIYNPIHSGVFWERNQVLLEDVERIEIIRGPGASVWGANAVNGIINIVTKSSKDTKGIYANVGGGNEHRQFSNFRVGNQMGKNFTWRVYGSNMDDGTGVVPAPQQAIDSLFYSQAGFRTDWTPSRQDTITIQGDFLKETSNQEGYVIPPQTANPRSNSNTMFLTRWSHTIDEDTDWALQTYYFNPYSANSQRTINTSMFDLDFQYHLKRERHDIVWGFGYRNNDEILYGGVGFGSYDTEQIPSYFVQDTITLAEDHLFLTLGSKFDHNSVTHFEYQPTIKLAWTPDERTSIWGAISRAVRTPSLLDRNAGDYQSEDALSYELGMRRQPTDKFFWELATFFTRYDSLIGTRGPVRENVGRGETYGFELNGTYEVNKRWHLTSWYAFLVENIYLPNGYTAIFTVGGAPRNEFYFQSGWDLGHNVSLDAIGRYVDSLEAGVEEYIVADINLTWRPTKRLELSLVGQNLLNGDYYEFVSSGAANPTKTEPGVYGMVSWRY